MRGTAQPDGFDFGAFFLGDGIEAITTGDTNPRMVIDKSGITVYDAAGVVIAKLDAVTGAVTLTAIISALNGSTFPAAGITGQLTDAQLQQIAAAKIAGQLTDAQLSAIAAAKIVGQLVNAQIADIAAVKITGQLTDAQIAALAAAKLTGQIVTTQITDNAISTAKLDAAAVTAAKIAADTITANEISAGAIGTSELSAVSVTAAKLAVDAVTAGAIAAGAVTAGKIAADAVTATEIAAGAVSTGELAALAVTTAKISAGAVTAAELAAASVIAGKIAADAVGTNQLIAGAVTAAKMTVAQLSAISADMGLVTAGTIRGALHETAAAHPKVGFDNTGVWITDATGVKVVTLQSADGLTVAHGTVEDPAAANKVTWKRASDGALVADIYASDYAINLGGGNTLTAHQLKLLLSKPGIPVGAAALVLNAFTTTGGIINIVPNVSVTLTDDAGVVESATILDAARNSRFPQLASEGEVYIAAGNNTCTWAGASPNSAVLAVAHGMPTAADFITSMPSGVGGPQFQVCGQPSGAANINFVMRDQTGAVPAAGATRSFYWIAIGIV